ncbi:MAG: L,D-transpeptidase family protein [Candidatus Thiodiazotropha sp.]
MVKDKQRFCYGILLCLSITAAQAAGAVDITPTNQPLAVPIESVFKKGLVIDWPQIERLYDRVQHNFIWHHAGKLTEQGREIFHWMAAADEEGLNASDYHVDHLRSLIDNPSPDVMVYRELLLTDGYFRLARDLRVGRYDPQAIDPQWMLPDEEFDPVDALTAALTRGELRELLNSLGPNNPAYLQLKHALAKYRDIQSRGGWVTVQAVNSLRPGETDPGIAMLRQRIKAESHLLESVVPDPNYFDANLASAVKQYQRRLGLQVDGIVGSATLQSLNDPIETRIAQIRANLERWRWLPHELESQHLMVNTAGFEITLVKGDQVVFQKRTVNGKLERQTPSFSSRVTHLVTNPLWTVPRTIAVQDILPRLQQDSEYLASKRFRIYARSDGGWGEIDPLGIDWKHFHEDNFPFVLKQDAGSGNSLGRIKFHMPNTHQIYLHDTPAQGLFEQPNRAFSSGCVRVEAAEQLAQLLVEYAEQPQKSWLQRALSSGETQITPLAKPMPVYLTYFTSWVDRGGGINFRPDIYQRDTGLMLVMGEGTDQVTAHHTQNRENPSL